MLKNGAKWDIIPVIEELSDFDGTLVRNFERNVVGHYNNFWGPSYFLDDEEAFGYYRWAKSGRKKGVARNFFIYEMAKVSRYAVPLLDNID